MTLERTHLRAAALLALAIAFGASLVSAAPGSPSTASSKSTLDAVAATEAYLAKVPAAERARSDAYFEGGYWLDLWSFLYGLAVAFVWLATGASARWRDVTRRLGRKRPFETAIYWIGYSTGTTLAVFPLSLYSGYFREHAYGLSNQTFADWLGDEAKGFAVGLALGSIAFVGLYAIFRRAPRTWWIWGAFGGIVFLAFVATIAPVYLAPIFNNFSRLDDPAVRDPILSMARANGIPVSEVYTMDASRQSKRISANVSGFLGTERITLNDNLLRRCSLAEIRAVMGHEMGHYVLHHPVYLIDEFGVVIVLGFAFLRWASGRSLARWGGLWGVREIGDVAALPLLAAIFSIYFFVMSPVINTMVRTHEAEADIFGLNASRSPDGMAEVALKLGEYRKLSPGPLEEFLFFDHPSGRNRILMAMRWKAEHSSDAAVSPEE